MPIYTKKGDKGETGLFSADPDKKVRIPKSSKRIEAIGALDELNSYLGLICVDLDDKKLVKFIRDIQLNIFTINSILAGTGFKFSASKTVTLEKKIDFIGAKLPKLANFLLPSGTQSATQLMYARALARKAERRVVALNSNGKVNPNILKYINRLSDMLFMLFRYVNYVSGQKEVIWKFQK